MDLQTVFLVSLGAAILALVGAIGKARWNWRKDIPPFTRSTRVAHLLLHPEHYTEADAVPMIRALTLAGILFLLVAVLALISQLALDIL